MFGSSPASGVWGLKRVRSPPFSPNSTTSTTPNVSPSEMAEFTLQLLNTQKEADNLWTLKESEYHSYLTSLSPSPKSLAQP